MSNEPSADKSLTRLGAWMLAFGCIIGWGSFVMPGTTFLSGAGPLGTVLALAFAGAGMALIAVNIGIFNLFPIPALDGGRLLFILIEMIFRRRVPEKYEKWVHAVGLVILLAFVAVISANDIIKLIRGRFIQGSPYVFY